MNSSSPGEIACQQLLLADSSVYSVQWLKMPRTGAAGVSPRFLLERYLEHIRRFTLTLVRPVKNDEGVEFRLIGSRVSLLSFNGPLAGGKGRGEGLVLRIRGGLLAQPDSSGRGTLSFLVIREEDRVRLVLELKDYFPVILGGPRPSRLRKRLYRLTQAYIHKKATISFLARLFGELSGEGMSVRVVRAWVHDGEEI